MNQHKHHISRCFNRAKESYDQSSHVQQMIGRQLIHFILLQKLQLNTIIDIGCGTGLITAELAKTLPHETFYAIDIADKLLEKARQRLKQYHIEIHHHDFENLNDSHYFFDLIFANMSLQWSTDLQETFMTLQQKLNRNGHFAFTLPLTHTFHELPNNSRNTYYSWQCIVDLLAQCGYKLITTQIKKHVYTFKSSLSALQSIKATGANYKFNHLQKSLRGKSLITHFHSKQEFSLTYHVGYFIARKNQ